LPEQLPPAHVLVDFDLIGLSHAPRSDVSKKTLEAALQLEEQSSSINLHDAEALRRENERHLETIRDLRQDRSLRLWVAGLSFVYLAFTSLAVFIILFFCGFQFRDFRLDTAVLTTLAGGTFASAVGLAGFVVKGLFPAPSNGRDHSAGKASAVKPARPTTDSLTSTPTSPNFPPSEGGPARG
jgi:hypothetical protein